MRQSLEIGLRTWWIGFQAKRRGIFIPNTVFQRVLLNAEDEAKAMGDSYQGGRAYFPCLIKGKNIEIESF